jgi:hypothetical protein
LTGIPKLKGKNEYHKQVKVMEGEKNSLQETRYGQCLKLAILENKHFLITENKNDIHCWT